jgi:hypothetical protein
MVAGATVAALMLMGWIGLWAAGVIKVKTADGILVVQVNEPNAEVFVDGDRVTVTWSDGGKKAEIHVKPGARKVDVKKDGFSADGTDLTFRDGDRVVFMARLLPEPHVTNAGQPAPDTKKPDTPPDHGKPDPPAETAQSAGDKKTLHAGMVFEGTKTWTKKDAVLPPGSIRQIRLTITEVDGPAFKGVYSAGDREPTTWSWEATGEFRARKIRWTNSDGGVMEGKFEGETLEGDAGNGVFRMKLVDK